MLPTWLDRDPAGLAVGGLVGLAGALFVLEPVVDPVTVRGRPVPVFVLSLFVLTAAFGLGAAVFLARGRRLFGVAHATGAIGWGLVLLGTVGVGPAFLLGVAVLVGGAAFLVSHAGG